MRSIVLGLAILAVLLAGTSVAFAACELPANAPAERQDEGGPKILRVWFSPEQPRSGETVELHVQFEPTKEPLWFSRWSIWQHSGGDGTAWVNERVRMNPNFAKYGELWYSWKTRPGCWRFVVRLADSEGRQSAMLSPRLIVGEPPLAAAK